MSKRKKHHWSRRQRRGAVVPLVALLTPVLLVLLGFAVDLAHMQNTRAELRMATDCAARAAAGELARTDDTNLARAAAVRVAEANRVAGDPLQLDRGDVEFGRSEEDASGRFSFVAGAQPYNSVRVNGLRTSQSLSGAAPLYFGSLIGRSDFEPTMTAVSSFANFDICLVLDRSTSMKLDLGDSNSGMSTSDPRFCKAPQQTSRWAALDTAVGVFISMLESSSGSEQVSLVTYSSDISGESWLNKCSNSHRTTNQATIDLPLSDDIGALNSEMSAWSSALFNGSTNIEAGLRLGLQTVTGAGSRTSADKVVILLTDGHENVGSVVVAANECAAQGVQVHALTFSDDADQALMSQVATIGNGRHLHARTAQQLVEIFQTVAGDMVRLTE